MSDEPPGFGTVFLFAVLSWAVLWFAKRNDYFKPLDRDGWKIEIRLWHVIAAFGIYFVASIFLPSILLPVVQTFLSPPVTTMHIVSWLTLLLSLSILGMLFVLFRSIPKNVKELIWRREAGSYQDDLKLAAITWCVSFPVVVFASQFLDTFVYYVFNVVQLPDQVAVLFVKMTFQEPLYFALAIVSIVVMAPLIEEVLFRGLLQSFIRKHTNPHQAILITSVCFAFFHFSPEQGLGNIPIIGSLFSLALFLGYIYERQGSLFASMALHALFNSISILNLYFLGGAPRGAL